MTSRRRTSGEGGEGGQTKKRERRSTFKVVVGIINDRPLGTSAEMEIQEFAHFFNCLG